MQKETSSTLELQRKLKQIVESNRPSTVNYGYYCVGNDGIVYSSHDKWLDAKEAAGTRTGGRGGK